MKNVYFSHGTSSEQRLYEDLIIESLKIYGFDVYYLPREFSNDERLFGEDPLAKFDENYMIEMYLANYEGFTGEGTLLTRFGVRIAEEATFIISKRRWEDLISSSSNLLTNLRPNEGDVIYFPLTNQLFQIKFVEHNKPFRQLGQIATYQLVCEVMEDSSERFETGVEEIDKIRREEGYSITFKVVDGIKSITVTNGGSGYTSNTQVSIAVLPGTITQAKAIPVLSGGVVTSISITDAGSGYTSVPGVFISGAGSNAQATAVLAPKGNFEYDEIVVGLQSGARGRLVRWDVRYKEVELIDVVGTFLDNECLKGMTSNAEWVIGAFSTIENQNDDFNENKWFEDEGDKIMDFNIANPFGEYANMDEDLSLESVNPVPLPIPTPGPSTPVSYTNTIGGILVDTSNLGPGTDNYVMMYDADTNKYIFVDPDSVLLAAANLPITGINPTGVPQAAADQIVNAADNAEVDGGNF
jgi:hypothetical protein